PGGASAAARNLRPSQFERGWDAYVRRSDFRARRHSPIPGNFQLRNPAMSQPYIGEIRIVGFNFAPQGWAFCDGSQMSISQNEALYNLIGTTYGGDGVQTFNLPNLLGRVPIHQGTDSFGDSYVIGQLSGVENVTV